MSIRMQDLMEIARRVPRSVRTRQGCESIRDYARHISDVRLRRAELRRPPGPVLPESVTDRLLAELMQAPPSLRREARRAAYCSAYSRAPFRVVSRTWDTPASEAPRKPWCEGRSGWTLWLCGRPKRYHRQTLVICLPVAWLVPRLARLRRRAK